MPGTRIGSLIARIRAARGLTQAELAGRLGVARTTISRWETGTTEPPLRALGPLCHALRVRSDVFVELPSGRVDRWLLD